MNSQTTSKRASSKPKASPASSHAQQHSGSTSGLQKLFEDELKDIYWAEKALTKAIPKMVKNSSSAELSDALQNHLKETEGQVNRLEKVFSLINSKVQGKKCEAMVGLIKEAEGLVSDSPKGYVRDAAIISAAQKVEHYEIASYGTLCAFAKTLGFEKAGDLLMETLEEEKGADAKLSQIGESSVNIHASSEDGTKNKRA